MNVQSTGYGKAQRQQSGSYSWAGDGVGSRVWRISPMNTMALLSALTLMSLDASADLMVRNESQAASKFQVSSFRTTAYVRPVLTLGLRPEHKSVGQAMSDTTALIVWSKTGEFTVRVRAQGETGPVMLPLQIKMSSFYDGQMRTLHASRGLDDLGAINRNFLSVCEAFRTGAPQAFDGSNYALIRLTYRPCPVVEAQQLPLYDLITGDVLMSPFASVPPQRHPPPPVAQRPASRILVAGGLLFGLLCCRRQPLQSLKSAPALAADLHWPELLAGSEVTVVMSDATSPAATSCIYNRMLRTLTQELDSEQNPNVATMPLFWRSFQGWDEILSFTPNPWKGRQRLIPVAHNSRSPSLT